MTYHIVIVALRLLPFLFLLISGNEHLYRYSNMQKTFSKDGELYLHPCAQSDIFTDPDPLQWPSCRDALEYTWTSDIYGDIRGVSAKDKVKLIRSNGYCPQSRCQLGNISSSGAEGGCPEGLCFMKLENGAVSFGACCYKQGAFNSNKMIGYYFKSQPTPKPIYKSNRIILGLDSNDESYDSFVNANEVFPNIIATQCPLSGYPTGYADTLDDVKRMILEQNVSSWISLAPVLIGSNATMENIENILMTGNRNCNAFPILLMKQLGGSLMPRSSDKYWNISYTVTGYIKFQNGYVTTQLYPPNDDKGWTKVSRTVEHLWYMGWKDFHLPPPEEEEIVVMLVARAIWHIMQGNRLLVSCLSGRGRSGTLITIIASLLSKTNTVSTVVDTLVRMRRSRDGLVETPAQFGFVIRMLGLGDPSRCGFICMIKKFTADICLQMSLYGVLWLSLASCLVFGFYFIIIRERRELDDRKKGNKVARDEKEPLLTKYSTDASELKRSFFVFAQKVKLMAHEEVATTQM